MKLLIIDKNFHPKNKDGLWRILRYLDIDEKWVTAPVDFTPYDVIYSPGMVLADTHKWPSKRFIFGPHLGVYPSVLQTINSIYADNAIYIQPSEWVRNLFTPMLYMPVKQFPFPIDTEKFNPGARINPVEGNSAILYFKMRDPALLGLAERILGARGFDIKMFHYERKYTETDYISALREARFVFWLGCHESQGFALQEALAMNVPALVWNARSLSDQWAGGRPDIPATTLSYWDDSCGMSFRSADQLEKSLSEFLEKLAAGAFQPREFIVQSLGVERCARKFAEVFLGRKDWP